MGLRSASSSSVFPTFPQFIRAFSVALMFSFVQLGRLHDDDCNQDVFTKLSDQVKSDFCKSVISISLCNGDYNATVVFLVFQQIYMLKHYQLNDSSCNLL